MDSRPGRRPERAYLHGLPGPNGIPPPTVPGYDGNWIDTVSGATIAAPGLRGVAGDTVLFASATGSTISLDGASPSVAAITFDNSNINSLHGFAGHGWWCAAPRQWRKQCEHHGLQWQPYDQCSPALDSDVTVFPAADSQLTISGGISGAGQSLTVCGPGTVILTGTDGYSRGTTVSAGRLIATNSSAMPANTSLTIGGWAGPSSSIRILRMSGRLRLPRSPARQMRPPRRFLLLNQTSAVSSAASAAVSLATSSDTSVTTRRAVAHKPGFGQAGYLGARRLILRFPEVSRGPVRVRFQLG